MSAATASGAARTPPQVFISHSSADNTFGLALADRLGHDLAPLGGSVWYDREGLLGGDDWMRRIEYQFVTRNVFVVLLSPAALASPWVEQEIRLALSYAIGQRRVIVPVLHRPVDNAPPFLTTYQFVSYLPARPADEAYAELFDAMRLSESRLREITQPLGAHIGPPFDLALLPPLDHFVGRDAELHQIERLLAAASPTSSAAPTSATSATSGLASIAAANGLGGIGKSTLAARALVRFFVAGRFPDGLAVVRCNGLDQPSEVLAQVVERFSASGAATVSGVASDDVRRAAPAQAARLTQTALRGKDALVVLDNVEPHWPVEQVIAPLRAAGVALLVTSRQNLPPGVVPEEATVEIQLLPSDQARDLFAKSYGAASWDALTAEEQAAAARIVAALDRHTLAVALAGVYVARRRQGRALSTLAAEYETSARRRVGPVAAVIATSVAALPAPAQRLFALLGAFPTGDLGRQTILHVAAALGDPDPAASLEALEDFRLVDAALNASMSPEADRERIRLHPLVRDVALEAVATWDPASQQDAADQIARAYGAYGDALDLADVDPGPDFPNLLAAITPDAIERWHTRGDTHAVAQLCHAIRLSWRDRSRTADLLRTLEWAVPAAERWAAAAHARPDLLRAAHLTLTYGQTLALIGQLDAAEALYQQNLAIHREVGDRRGEGVDLSTLGSVAQARGQLDEAERYYQQSLPIRREVGDRRGEGVVLAQLGLIAEAREQWAEAEDAYRACLTLMEQTQDALNEAIIALILGRLLIQQRGQPQEGCALLQRAYTIRRDLRLPGVDDARATLRALGCLDA